MKGWGLPFPSGMSLQGVQSARAQRARRRQTQRVAADKVAPRGSWFGTLTRREGPYNNLSLRKTAMRRVDCGLALILLLLCSSADGQNTRPTAEERYTVAFASFAPLDTGIFIAAGDGSDAKPLLAHPDLDYNASFSPDGRSIAFTSTRNGSADIYRVGIDGANLQRLTDDPAFDDQGLLSPDNKSMAFVSSRSGQADIWILELATPRPFRRHRGRKRSRRNQGVCRGGGSDAVNYMGESAGRPGLPPPVATAVDKQISGVMQQCRTNFAKTSYPNGGLLPVWPKLDVASRAYIQFITDAGQ